MARYVTGGYQLEYECVSTLLTALEDGGNFRVRVLGMPGPCEHDIGSALMRTQVINLRLVTRRGSALMRT